MGHTFRCHPAISPFRVIAGGISLFVTSISGEQSASYAAPEAVDDPDAGADAGAF
jgi:hypothetical protein